MTSRGTWKAAERKVAKFFNTERTPLSGGCSKHTRSDTLHEKIYVENKYKKKHTILSLYDDTAMKAKKEKKLPLITIEEKGRSGFWIILKSDDFGRLIDILGYTKK
jgi:hypothetical protein